MVHMFDYIVLHDPLQDKVCVFVCTSIHVDMDVMSYIVT